jgi:hypothetical protein
MISVLVSLLLSVRCGLRSRAALQLEVLALRHQLQVLNRSRPRRLRLVAADWCLWHRRPRFRATVCWSASPRCSRLPSTRIGSKRIRLGGSRNRDRNAVAIACSPAKSFGSCGWRCTRIKTKPHTRTGPVLRKKEFGSHSGRLEPIFVMESSQDRRDGDPLPLGGAMAV